MYVACAVAQKTRRQRVRHLVPVRIPSKSSDDSSMVPPKLQLLLVHRLGGAAKRQSCNEAFQHCIHALCPTTTQMIK